MIGRTGMIAAFGYAGRVDVPNGPPSYVPCKHGVEHEPITFEELRNGVASCDCS